MTETDKLLVRIGTARDAISMKTEQTSLDYMIDGVLMNCSVLLKEQEAVKPILEQDSMVCGVCGHEVIWQKMLGDGIWADEELDYCPHCGRQVKWDD